MLRHFLATFFVLFCTAFIVGCSLESQIGKDRPKAQLQPLPLKVVKIGFDRPDVSDDAEMYYPNTAAFNTKQIVFHFNQPVAILGAVPNQSQINAINISNDLHKACTWRFLKLHQMACELTEDLKPLTHYDVKIDTTFKGLKGNTLIESKKQRVTTGLPQFFVDIEDRYLQFPTYFKLINGKNSGLSIKAISDGLKLKTPTGTYLNVLVEGYSERWEKNSLKVKLLEKVDSFPDGFYELVFKKGFKPTASQYGLDKELVVKRFPFYSKPVFLGFSCPKGQIYRDDIKLSRLINNEVQCSPEAIELVFSAQPKLTNTPTPKGQQSSELPWLKGPKFKVTRQYVKDGYYTIRVNLSGDSTYHIDLKNIEFPSDTKITSNEVIEFKTQPSTPLWLLGKKSRNVVEYDRNSAPLIFLRNVELLEQHTTPISSSQSLHSFLNNRQTYQKNNRTSKIVEANAKSKKWLEAHFVEYEKELKTETGLAFVEWQGKSLKSQYEDKVAIKKGSTMLQSAATNLVVWHTKELIVQVFDWDANPMPDTEVTLVCENQVLPKAIGKTDKTGTLWLQSQKWQSIFGEHTKDECWLWASTSIGTTAIKLDSPRFSILDETNVYAWTAQPVYLPGNSVDFHFIGRKRSEHGLTPISDLSEFEFIIATPSSKEIFIPSPKVSSQGFGSFTFDLPINETGRYVLYLKKINSNQKVQLKRLNVVEFVPPEFEVSISAPKKVIKGEPLDIVTTARRMNGIALENGMVNIKANISRRYDVPENWPNGFEYVTWQDFKRNENDQEQLPPFKSTINELGQVNYQSTRLASTVPMGKVNINVETTSDDGEVQGTSVTANYFAREHFIGSKHNASTRKLDVIAVTEDGNEVKNISVLVEFKREVDRDEGKSTDNDKPTFNVIATCKLTILPSSCDVPKSNEKLEVTITSGTQNYQWMRTLYPQSNKPSDGPTLNEQFELAEIEDAKVDETISAKLTSPLEGKVNFILYAGGIKKIWQQSVVKGVNSIALNVEPSWVPNAKIYASMIIARDVANKAVIARLTAISDEQNLRGEPERRNLPIDSQRVLTSEAFFLVAPKSKRPKINLAVSEQTVKAGSEITISITSDKTVETQVWIVNEALHNLMNVQDQDFDYFEQLISHNSLQSKLAFSALSNYLTLDSYWSVGDQGIGKERRIRRVPPPLEGIAFNMPAVYLGASVSGKLSDGQTSGVEGSEAKKRFAQSISLDTISLQAGETKEIKVQLPQLIGRWKILALSADAETMSIDTATVSTTRDIEYFVDAPTTIFDNDQAEFAVTRINTSGKSRTDQMQIWIDKKLHQTANIKLKPHGYERTAFLLPSLSAGKHSLRITSQTQPDFATYHEIDVVSSHLNQEKTWLNDASLDNHVAAPSNAIIDSISISTLATGQQSPAWSPLLRYNQNYAYQCWEQTISRALEYNVNPLAQSQWPEGQETLQKLINQRLQKQYGWPYFGYFKNGSIDTYLSAYTFLLAAWLNDGPVSLPLNMPEIKVYIEENIFDVDSLQSSYLKVDTKARSMAMLALAVNGDIELSQALEARQKIGASDPHSSVLQALALKTLGATPELYLEALDALQNDTYLDQNVGISNQNSDKCLAAMTYPSDSAERETLLSQVIASQQQTGHFGSTFANGLCAMALRDKATNEQGVSGQDDTYQGVTYKEVPKDQIKIDANNVIHYQTASEKHWVKMQYQTHMHDAKPEANGLAISRLIEVKRNDKWIPITDLAATSTSYASAAAADDLTTETSHTASSKQALKIGELVRTTINVESGTSREHVAINDSIAGGFEAINPSLDNALYQQEMANSWFRNNWVEIQNGRAFWYLGNLSKGKTKLTYFSRVRHIGQFNIGPATAETMYRTDVYGNTGVAQVLIEQ